MPTFSLKCDVNLEHYHVFNYFQLVFRLISDLLEVEALIEVRKIDYKLNNWHSGCLYKGV